MSGESAFQEPSPQRGQDLAQPASLRDALERLTEEIRTRASLERVVAVVGLRNQVEAVGAGVPAGEVRAFEASILTQVAAAGVPADVAPLLESALDHIESMRAPVVVPADSPRSGFLAAVVIEANPDLSRTAGAAAALQAAMPVLFRRAETQLLRSRLRETQAQLQRSRTALGALPDPVLVMDTESRILLANRRAEELLVTGPDDRAGRRHAVETNNLFFSAFRARAILDTDRSAPSRELLLVDPTDGSDLLFEVWVLPFRDDQGGAESSIFVLRDITDLRHAASELKIQFSRSLAAEHQSRLESERLNVIIENAGVPIFVTDPQANVILMNREAERLLAVSQSGTTTSPRVQNIRTNDAKLAGFINEFTLNPRLRREGQLTLVDPDGAREFPALAVSTKILDDHFEPTAVVTVLRDLTQEVENQHLAEELRKLNRELEERVKAATSELAERNAQLERQRSELERASRLKSEFLATMSHELRTPINAVLGYNSLLRDGLFGSLTDKQDDALHRMRNAAEHLLSLINDILDLSRIEAGKVNVSAAEIDVASFLDELSETVRPMAEQKALAYRVEIAPDVASIRSDGMRLRQVLLNLLSNAVKFTHEGSVTLSATSHGGHGRVCFAVVDTGIGIDEAHLETIFEEFTQADQSVTREHGGTGLGLAISRKLIRVLGGSLAVESEVGVGTSFRVELPAVPPVAWGDTESPQRPMELDAVDTR